MSEIKTKIRTYNDVIDLFGEEKAADMLSEALDWSTIDPKNDKKNIMERKPLLLDPYMTYEGEDYCKHIVAGFLGDRDLDWASGYIDEEKIKNGQVMPADLKSALSMALDNELSTSWAYLDALSSQCAEIFNKFAGYIESAGLARGVLVPGEYELDHDALNADVSERFNIQYGFQCDQMIDAMQFDMTLILTEKVDSMDGYRLIQSVCDWREENLEVIEDAENNLDYGKVPSYVAYERPADIGTTIIDELCASQGTAVEKLVNYPTTKFERTMRDEFFEALAVNETTISLMAKVPSSVFLDAVACMDSRYMSGHTVDTGHAFIVSPGTYEPYIGIHDPVYGAGYMMVDLDKPFEIPMNRIWIAMDDYSGPETKEGLRGMYHSPQDVSAFSDPFCGSVSVTPTRDEKQEPAKSGLEAQAVNHISPDDVEHLTTIDAYMEQICRILDRIADEIVGYNIAFDIGFLKAAGATINPDAAIIDTMQEFMDAFGNSNTGHRYQPLSMAAERLGYNWTSAPHGSLSDTLACLAAQKCVDEHNWCVENLELTEDAIMHAKPIENGSEGLPKDCWDLNPGGRPFAVTEPILHRLQSSAKLCARAGTTTQFTRMTVNQWFDKAERSQRSPLGRSVDIGRAASALNSQHEHAEVPQGLTK